jgi:phospholipid/cholesterol/gamma-HCH transport system substrate-binding protein
MQYFRPEVRVGVFLFVSLTLLIAGALVVGQVGTWFTPKHTYTVLFPTANLLRQRAQVSFAGSPVGEVTAITLRSEAARAQQHPDYPVAVTVVVQADIPLRTDARIELKTDGFIGERYVDISPGTAALVPDGGTIPGRIGGVEGLLASFSGVGGGLDNLTNALQTLLGDPSQPHSLPATLANVSRLIDTLLPRLLTLITSLDGLLQGVQQDVSSISTQAGNTLQRLDATIAENRDGLKRLVQELNTTVGAARQTVGTLQHFIDTTQGDVSGLLGSLRTASGSLQQSTQALSGRVQKLLANVDTVVLQNDRNLYATVENLRDVTENLKVASQLIRTNPSVILWGTHEKQTPDSGPVPAAHDGAQALRDRGRIGRYDRAP